MRIIFSGDREFVFNLERGEELFTELLRWSTENKIEGATLTGLGAADLMEVAYYNLETKEYEKHTIEEPVEILSLTGNLGTLDGKKMLHIHGVFGRRDLSTFGGHIFSLQVSGACEVHFTETVSALNRAYDEDTGLNLMCEV